MMRLLRAGPATTRSTASSSSYIVICVLFSRAARIAASLSRLARSAPEKPAVWRATRMHFEYLLPPAHVGVIQPHLPVEASGTQQRGIEHVGPVGRGHHDN